MRSKHYVRTIALALSLALTLVLGGCTSQEPVGGVSAPRLNELIEQTIRVQ